MESVKPLLVCGALSGLLLGIPPLAQFISDSTGGAWFALLVGWATIACVLWYLLSRS